MLLKLGSIVVDVSKLVLVEKENYPAQSITGCRLHFDGGHSVFISDLSALEEIQNYAPSVSGAMRSTGTT